MPQEVNKKSRSDNPDDFKGVSLCRREEFAKDNLHSAACSDLKDMKMRNRFCADKQEILEDDMIEERLIFGDDAAFSTNGKMLKSIMFAFGSKKIPMSQALLKTCKITYEIHILLIFAHFAE